MDERSRAMIHDLIIAITERRETTESEPVPRRINEANFSAAVHEAVTSWSDAKVKDHICTLLSEISKLREENSRLRIMLNRP